MIISNLILNIQATSKQNDGQNIKGGRKAVMASLVDIRYTSV
jgi:hypothetical protein